MTSKRPLLPLADATLPLYAGVDVGGTNIKIGLVDDGGQTVAFKSIPTEQRNGAQDAAGRVAEAVRSLCEAAGIEAGHIARAGLVTPGPLDIPAGQVLTPGNLPGWHYSPIRDLFAAALGVPVTLENDATAAAWGEYWQGAGANYASMVLITLGTGVGGGIILDDKLIVGAHLCGAEIGHIIIDSRDDAPLNTLGVRGTLEGYCGAQGVVERAKSRLADDVTASSLRDADDLTPHRIALAAEAGDVLAMEVIIETAKYLAIGIVTCIHMLDPESVVVGGGMNFGGPASPLGERFIDRVRREAQQRMIATFRDKVVIDFAALGGDAGYIGAAGLARLSQ